MINYRLLATAPADTAPISGFNLKVSLLPASRAMAIRRAVDEGWLDGFICSGQLWVSRADVHDLAPAGHDTYDESDECCFIGEHLIARDTSAANLARQSG